MPIGPGKPAMPYKGTETHENMLVVLNHFSFFTVLTSFPGCPLSPFIPGFPRKPCQKEIKKTLLVIKACVLYELIIHMQVHTTILVKLHNISETLNILRYL